MSANGECRPYNARVGIDFPSHQGRPSPRPWPADIAPRPAPPPAATATSVSARPFDCRRSIRRRTCSISGATSPSRRLIGRCSVSAWRTAPEPPANPDEIPCRSHPRSLRTASRKHQRCRAIARPPASLGASPLRNRRRRCRVRADRVDVASLAVAATTQAESVEHPDPVTRHGTGAVDLLLSKSGTQRSATRAAVGSIIGRMAAPGSERAT